MYQIYFCPIVILYESVNYINDFLILFFIFSNLVFQLYYFLIKCLNFYIFSILVYQIYFCPIVILYERVNYINDFLIFFLSQLYFCSIKCLNVFIFSIFMSQLYFSQISV